MFQHLYTNSQSSKFLNQEGRDVRIDEKVNDKDFEKPHCEIETYESIEEVKYPQD